MSEAGRKNNRGSIPCKARKLLRVHGNQTGSGAHQTYTLGTKDHFAEIMQQGPEDGHSIPSRTMVRNSGGTPRFLISFHGLLLNELSTAIALHLHLSRRFCTQESGSQDNRFLHTIRTRDLSSKQQQ
jgi:hypothetical protein